MLFLIFIFISFDRRFLIFIYYVGVVVYVKEWVIVFVYVRDVNVRG